MFTSQEDKGVPRCARKADWFLEMTSPQENKRRRDMPMEFKMKKYRTAESDSILIVLAVVIIGVLFAVGEFHSLYSAIQW